MTFWDEVLANFLGAVLAGSLFVLLYKISASEVVGRAGGYGE
jgi:hypothetical protein